MGDLGIDYSQWIGTLSGNHWETWDINDGKNHTRGIAIENLKLDTGAENMDPITLGAFHSWFSEKQVFYGIYADTMINDFGTTLCYEI